MKIREVLISRGFIKTIEYGWLNLNFVKNIYTNGEYVNLDLTDGSTIGVERFITSKDAQEELDAAMEEGSKK